MIRPISSASNLHRRAACPGSERLETGLPDQKSDVATEGDMLHANVGKLTKDKLASERTYCVEFCEKTEAELIRKLFGEDKPKILREVELTLNGEVFGHADVIAVWKGKAMCLDWKFGRIAVDPAEANYQLRAYALMVADTYGCDSVVVGIVQPRLSGDERVSLASYSQGDFVKAADEIDAIRAACKAPDAPLHATIEGCRYCRAKATCPEMVKQVDEIALQSPATITSMNAADLYNRAKIVEKHVDAIKSAVFLLVQNAEAQNIHVPGISLKLGQNRRTIKDPVKAFQALSAHITPEAFAACCAVKVGELSEAHKTATGLKGKAAKESFETALAGLIEEKRTDPSLQLEEVA